MDTNNSKIKVLMFPWLAHGHISPFLELAKKLTKRSFHIYLCSTPINLSSIKKGITEKYSLSIQPVELHLPSSPELPPHHHTTNGLPAHLMCTLKEAFEMASPLFSNILETLNPDLVIYDFNQPWAATIALTHSIPAVQFLTFGATFLSFVFNMVENPGVNFPFPSIYLHKSERKMIRQVLEASANGVKDEDRILEAHRKSCDIVLIKSFKEIEQKYMDYLSVLAKKKIVPVGPLVQDLDNGDDYSEILQWLDKKSKSSTIFISFGSEYFLSREEMEEIAHALELTELNFIWVVRFSVGKNISVEEAMPKGFLERVGERGMVVLGWAPQAKILEHSSTGGFVSHCGWSSIMESVKFGVPIIGLPMQIDQPLNARLMEEVGVCMEVKRGKNEKLERDEIAKVIRNVVVEKNGEHIRNKARELSEKMKMKGDEEIDGLVEELVRLCKKR